MTSSCEATLGRSIALTRSIVGDCSSTYGYSTRGRVPTIAPFSKWRAALDVNCDALIPAVQVLVDQYMTPVVACRISGVAQCDSGLTLSTVHLALARCVGGRWFSCLVVRSF